MLTAALLGSGAGLAWLALAMDVHWRQVRNEAPLTRRKAFTLRSLGVSALAVSLFLCLTADHATIAALVWLMSIAGGALAVALILAWRPRALRALVIWV